MFFVKFIYFVLLVYLGLVVEYLRPYAIKEAVYRLICNYDVLWAALRHVLLA